MISEGDVPVDLSPEFYEVNYSPMLGLGGPLEAVLSDPASAEDIYQESLEEIQEEASLKKEFYVITSKDTLYNALQCFGVRRDQISSWIALAKPHYNLARLKPGQSFYLYLDEARQPVRFEFKIDRRSLLVIERTREGYQARKEEKEGRGSANEEISSARPVPGWVDPKTGYHYYLGTVTSSFYQSAVAAGMTPGKVMALIRVFSGVNFDREIRSGDHFRVVVAPGKKEGEEGPILAAMVETKGKPRYRFRVEDGKTAEYYNEKGEGGQRASSGFICPVRGARVTSGFTSSRFHPILHVRRPHYGIDYAARSGTPVRAAADGTVTYASWKGQFGRTVAVKHGSIVSQYAHLSGFGPGVKVGKFVKKGAVVGYIGSTGLSTGPHLDYRMYKNGVPVNPAKVTFTPPPPSAASRKLFAAARERYMPELERDLPYGPAIPWSPPVALAQVQADTN